MSIGTPLAACIEYPPALSAPKRTPAPNTPHGRERPSSATVIASKPMPASMPEVKPLVSVPSTWVDPATPASAPEMSIA